MRRKNSTVNGVVVRNRRLENAGCSEFVAVVLSHRIWLRKNEETLSYCTVCRHQAMACHARTMPTSEENMSLFLSRNASIVYVTAAAKCLTVKHMPSLLAFPRGTSKYACLSLPLPPTPPPTFVCLISDINVPTEYRGPCDCPRQILMQ